MLAGSRATLIEGGFGNAVSSSAPHTSHVTQTTSTSGKP
jgi:hypothetical protein